MVALERGCPSIGVRGVAVAFGVQAFASSRAPIPAGPPSIGGRVLTAGGGAAQRLSTDRSADHLLGLRGGLVAMHGLVVAQFGVVVTALRGPITLLGLVIATVGGFVAALGSALAPDVLRTVPADIHTSLTSRTSVSVAPTLTEPDGPQDA